MYACIDGLAYVVFEVLCNEGRRRPRPWKTVNISIHFLWQEGNCWNDLRKGEGLMSSRTQFATDNEA